MAQSRVFVDANTIIGAFGVARGQPHLWRAICGHFSVETVGLCAEETQRGDRSRASYVPVSQEELGLAKVHLVAAEVSDAFEDLQDLPVSGKGEAQLLALLHSGQPAAAAPHGPLPPGYLISTADLGALRIVRQLGWLEGAVSLEWMAREAGADFPPEGQIPRQHKHHSEDWLQAQKRRILR